MKALSHFETAIKIDPDYAEAHYNLGNIKMSQRSYPSALNHYQLAFKIDPKAPTVCHILGRGYYATGDHQSAQRILALLEKSDPDMADTLSRWMKR